MAKTMTEPKCLKCGDDIEYDDCYDIEYDGDWVERFYTGHCVKCNTDHLWSELYEFKSIEKLRIENDDTKDE